MNRLRRVACAIALAGLCSCRFIDAQPGAEKIRVVDGSQVSECELAGTTTASVTDHVGFINRDPASIDEDLVTLARNSALKVGGDTIVPGERPKAGERRFSVYRCLK